LARFAVQASQTAGSQTPCTGDTGHDKSVRHDMRKRRFAGVVPCLAAAMLGLACGPTNVGDFPPGAVTVAALSTSSGPDKGGPSMPPGWMNVEEHGWFVSAMPASPRTTFETIHLEGALLHAKALSASDGASVWTWIRYFEVSNLTTMLDADTLARAARDNFLGIPGVHFLRDEPPRPGGPMFDFACTVDPHTPLDPSARPMVARVRGYKHSGTVSRVTFAIAVWPADASDESARAFFEAFRVTT
jgi:hypothetical protein